MMFRWAVKEDLLKRGTLTSLPGSPFPACAGTVALALASSGRYLYAVNGGERTVAAFSVDGGSGTPQPLGTRLPCDAVTRGSIAVDGNGRFVYVAGRDSDRLWEYAVEAATGELTPLPGSPRALHAGPRAVAIVWSRPAS